MKIIYLFLLIILGCGDEMSKPERFIFNTNETNTGSIESYEEDGFEFKEILSSETTNGLFVGLRKWTEYMDRVFGKVYYVNPAIGIDSNDGSESHPLETLDYAASLIESGGYGTIIMSGDGEDYYIGHNFDVVDKTVVIIPKSGVAAHVTFISYTNTGENDIYHANIYKGGNLIIFADTINVGAPNNSGDAWSTTASCVHVYDQASNIVFAATSGINFSNTAAASGEPSLVMPRISIETGAVGVPIVQANGAITTNAKGYVLNSLGQSCILNSTGSIDNPEYWVENGVEKVLPAKIGMTFSLAAANLVLNYDSSTVVRTIYGTDSDATILSALTSIFAPIMGLSEDLFSVEVTRDETNFTKIELFITGTGNSLPSVLYGLDHSRLVLTPSAGTINNYNRAIHRVGKYEKNINITTNITDLK